MTLRNLLEKRDTLVTDLRGILSAGDGATLSAEDTAKFDRVKAEVAALDATIKRQAELDELERRADGAFVGSGDTRLDDAIRSSSILGAIRAQIPEYRDSREAGLARELSAEMARRSGRKPEGLFVSTAIPASTEKRVFTTTNPAGGPGSNLIQTTVDRGQFIDRLREQTQVRRLGARILTGLTGNLAIPRLKASATASWVAENAAITATDPQVEQITFTPKHAGGIVEYSRTMLMQDSPQVEDIVRSDLALLLAVAIDNVSITGGGANQPSGLLAAGSGIGSVAIGANGGDPTWTAIVNLIAAVDIANGLGMGSPAFLSNGRVTSKLRRTLKSATDTASNWIMTDPNNLAGYLYASSQNVPSNLTKGTSSGVCSALIFGDFSQLFIGFWSELDVLVNPYESAAYSKGNVQVRAMMTADVKIRQPLAFAAIQDLTTV